MSIISRNFVGLFVLLFLYAVLSGTALSVLSPTQDEPLHLSSGHSYWEHHDYRLQPENGILSQRLIGLPLYLMGAVGHSLEDPEWIDGQQWFLAARFYEVNGKKALRTSRSVVAAIGAILLIAVYLFALRNGGVQVAVLSGALFAFSPSILALSSLATSDLVLTVCYFLTSLALWSFLGAPTWLRIGLLGLCAGLAAASKYSAVSLALVALVYLIFLSVQHARDSATRDSLIRWIGVRLGGLVAAGLIAYGTIWSFYGFRYETVHPRDTISEDPFYVPLEFLQKESTASEVINYLMESQVFPESYLYGAQQTYYFAQNRSAFFMGETRFGGWFAFFPMAFILKTSPWVLFLLLLAAVISISLMFRRRGAWGRCTPDKRSALTSILFFCLPPVAVYFCFAMSSTLNIGHRHILPIYPFLFLLCGSSCLFINQVRRAWMFVSFFGMGQFLSAVSVAPNFLSYFNLLGGGSDVGHHYLVDSSYDWGQEMYRIQQWESAFSSEERAESLNYVLFAPLGPEHYGLEGHLFYQFGSRFRWWEELPELRSGKYIVSATMQAGPYFASTVEWTDNDERLYSSTRMRLAVALEEFGDDAQSWQEYVGQIGRAEFNRVLVAYALLRAKRLCLVLQTTEPIDRIGRSFFVYELSDEIYQNYDLGADIAFPSIGFISEMLSPPIN